MIVWSRGLGKQRLPLELAASTLHVKSDVLTLEGVVEPVCWEYAIRLGPEDLADFLKLMARPQTARFLAERGGLLAPFVLGLISRAPGALAAVLFRRRPDKGGDDALLV
jgi:hypothetical protein